MADTSWEVRNTEQLHHSSAWQSRLLYILGFDLLVGVSKSSSSTASELPYLSPQVAKERQTLRERIELDPTVCGPGKEIGAGRGDAGLTGSLQRACPNEEDS